MGDRGVIEVKKGNEPSIYFYTHWEAYRLTETVAKGLEAGQPRWGDESYLNRIIFDTLTGLSGGETGFGISTWCPTDAYLKVTIDHEYNTVQVFTGFDGDWGEPSKVYGFADFIALMKSPDGKIE